MVQQTLRLSQIEELIEDFPAPQSPKGYPHFRKFFLNSIYSYLWQKPKESQNRGFYNYMLLTMLQKQASTYYILDELRAASCHTTVPVMHPDEIPFNEFNIFTHDGLAITVNIEPMCSMENADQVINQLHEGVEHTGVRFNPSDAQVSVTALIFATADKHKKGFRCAPMELFPPSGENKDLLISTPHEFAYANDLDRHEIYPGTTVAGMGRLIINTIMLIKYQPSLVTVKQSISSGAGFGQKASNEPMPVRWLGKGFSNSQVKDVSTQDHKCKGGTHASPRAHWRRGHWHGYRYGEGRKTLKRKWVQPVYVNPSLLPREDGAMPSSEPIQLY